MIGVTWFEMSAITLSCVLLAHHVWVKRHELARYIPQLENLRRPSKGCKQSHVDEKVAARQRALQDAFGKMRVANFRSTTRYISQNLLLTVPILLIFWRSLAIPHPSDAVHRASVMYILVINHLLFLCVDEEYISLTEGRVDAIVSGLHLLTTLRTFLVPDNLQAIVCFSPIHALLRATVCLLLLDWKKNAVLNLFAFVAQVTKLYIVSQTTMLDRLPALIMAETLVFAMTITLSHVGDVWLRDLVNAKLDVMTLENSQLAARKLLSVLCDADVMLGPDFKILSSSMKLSHLLMRGSGGSPTMDGVDFCSCIIESDRCRFREFIASSMMQEDDIGQPVPAASLHLNLRDSAGLKVSVRVFHVAVPNLDFMEGLSHLIGFRDEGSICDLPDTAPPVQAPEEAEHHLAEVLRMLSPDGDPQEDMASGCSSEDWNRSMDKVVIDVDALSRNLNIRKATVHYKSHEDSSGPGLIEYLASSSQVALLRVVQDHANEVLQTMSAFEALHKETLTICLPRHLGGKTRIKCTRLHCSADAPPSDADCMELPMKLEFLDLTQRRARSTSEGHSQAGMGDSASAAGGLLPRILEGVTVLDAK
eukprot:TRINITY_DN44821_c0_g1_i1.p1 TRINITY_DN44821_c0_g1~~TRINITY_DN44821_c0_g1_i1.p1  ORF type:complete len:592 (-),score=106.27 TRINITY_DN44821_c0_g1_i1:445-2220(-)